MSLWVASQFADEIVDAINGQEWSQSFSAKKRFAPLRKIEDTNKLEVSVVPAQSEDQFLIDRRAKAREEVLVLVAVQKTVNDQEDNAEIDPLAFLAQEVADWIRENLKSITYDNAPTNSITGSQISVVHEHLLTVGLFSAFIEVSYRAVR